MWVPCSGHNLHLSISKGLAIGRVWSTVEVDQTASALRRSPNMFRQLKKKQKDLWEPEQRLIHDEPTADTLALSV